MEWAVMYFIFGLFDTNSQPSKEGIEMTRNDKINLQTFHLPKTRGLFLLQDANLGQIP